MNVGDARSALRWAVLNPDAAEAAGTRMLESVPQVMTTIGAFMLSEWLSKKIDAAKGKSLFGMLGHFGTPLKTPEEAANFLAHSPLTGATTSLPAMPPASMSMQQIEGVRS